MKCRLNCLGRKLLSLGLAITLIVTIIPSNLLAQVGPDVHFQLDKSYYQVGESPVHIITGAAPNSPIYLSSFKNGSSTGEVDVWYGHMTDGQGNATFGAGPYQSSDAGVWTKVVKVAGRQTPFFFAVGSIPQSVPPMPNVGFTMSSLQVDAASGRQYIDINMNGLVGLEGKAIAFRTYFTNDAIPQTSENLVLGTDLSPVYCDGAQEGQDQPGVREVLDPDRYSHPNPCTQCVVRGQLRCIRGYLIDLGISLTVTATVAVTCVLAVLGLAPLTAGASIALGAVCGVLSLGTLFLTSAKAKNDMQRCVCDQTGRCSGQTGQNCNLVTGPYGVNCG